MMMRRMVPMMAALSLISMVSLVPVQAAAAEPTVQLRAQIQRVLKLLDDPSMKQPARAKERRIAMRAIANDIFDFTETAKRALGRHWAGRTAAEREQFVQLFADLLERSYISKVEVYAGEAIEYTGEILDGDQATVSSRIVTRQGLHMPIQYRMQRKGDRWLVYDVVIEGVSLVANYRSQFNKIIQTSSFADLVKKLKSRQEELGA
jgi:phospholipid transport system substrate-binding protein